MNAWMLLSDAATGHNDGTISMLRAGLNRLKAPQTPIALKTTLVARVETEPSERGTHDFSIRCIDADGREKLPELKGTFETPPSGGQHNLLIGLNAALDSFGSYSFRLVIDRTERAHLSFKAEKLEAQNVGEDV